MKKIQNYAIAAAALVFGLASCTVNGGNSVDPVGGDGETAYVSIKIDRPQRNSRASDEEAGSEGDIKSAYIVTFDENGTVVRIPEGGYFISILGESGGNIPSAATTNKVGAETTHVMVVANPGTKVMAALNALAQGSTLTAFNQAIAGITAAEIQPTTGIFTMISSPADALNEEGDPYEDGDVISSPLIEVDPSVVGDGTGEFLTDALAIADAIKPENVIAVRVERLVSKLLFNTVNNPTKPAGSWFEFTSWTVDALNTTFYPYASRTLFDTHHAAGHYTFNFYTQDPNFADVAPYHNDGSIVYATVPRNATDGWAPVLPWSGHYGWMDDVSGASGNNVAYLVENTMAGAAQRYGNATRVVIKGKYTPPGFTEGEDWFRFGGTNYQTLEDLQAAYSSTTVVDASLKAACDAFLAQVKVANPAAAATFVDLTQAQLDAITEHGGEVAKVPVSGVGIRWFQNSVNYWFYEIRHDQEITGTMAFGKYGVVRNNWYNLTLNEVSGFGTPWYPDLIEPGDGDPQPEDPIDSKYGYIGITITPANWIVWDTGFKI